MRIVPLFKQSNRLRLRDKTISTFYYRCDLPDGRILWGDPQNSFWGEQRPPDEYLISSWYTQNNTVCRGWDQSKAVKLSEPKVFEEERMWD